MSRGYRLSIKSLFMYDPTIFTSMTLPSGVDMETLIDKLLIDCCDFEVVYPDPNLMKENIRWWSKARLRSWEMYNEVLNKEGYEPFNDFDRNIEHTEVEERNLSTNSSDVDSVKAFNTDLLEEANANRKSIDDTGNVTRKITERQFGNSALGTNQDIIQKEIQLRRKLDIYSLIIRDFKQEFCILVY